MLFLNEYRVKPYAPKAGVKLLMDVFAARGAEPGTVAHYVRADGAGGIVIIEQDDVAKAYESVLAYSEFLEQTITPILPIEDAVGPILAFTGSS